MRGRGPSLAPEAHRSIPVLDSKKLSRDVFVREYMDSCQPVIIRGVADGWRATTEWVTQEGSPDLDFLAAAFGDSRVNVSATGHGYGEDSPQEVTLLEYVSWWKSGRGGSLYLKDWHFATEHPEYQAYTCPAYFQDDWLNAWLDEEHSTRQQDGGSQSDVATSDYRFVYLGPQARPIWGTCTPLHHDVLLSHSWSVNVAGVKDWTLVPPSHAAHVIDPASRQTAQSLDPSDSTADPRFPRLALASAAALRVRQYPGEAIFVPSGWYHQVTNVTDALSINHNWINATAMPGVLTHLIAETRLAAALLEDCRALCSAHEFAALVTRNVEASAGLGWTGLLRMLHCARRAAANRETVDCWIHEAECAMHNTMP